MNPANSSTTTSPTPLPPGEGLGRGAARMEWIDAMRGFTMFLVVAAHMSYHGYQEPIKNSLYLSIFVLFRMPLFFFISGFLAYSSKVVWSARTLGQLTLKKLRVQMLPTIVFFSLFIVVATRSFWDGFVTALHSDMKGGYWFTYILLLMFVIYYLFAYAESKFIDRLRARHLGWLPITLFWLLWLGVYATWFMPLWFTYPKDDFFQWTSFGQVIQYFHFFLAGNIVHRYWAQFQRLFDSKWFAPLLITLGTLCMCELFKWHELRLQWRNLPRTLCMYSLMTLVILYFRHYADAFSKQTRLGRTLQYIGVRTLDIYLIHAMLIPSMPFVGKWLADACHCSFVVDISLSFAGALVVVLFCVIISNIIRISPLLKYYLFGRK